MAADLVRRRVVFSGRVQGVFFRDTARRHAERLGIAGWVSNRPDGGVEAVFEGSPEEVEQLIELCRAGPRGAEVERVEIAEEAPEGLTDFSIR